MSGSLSNSLSNYHPDIQTFFNNLGVEHIPKIAKLLNGYEKGEKNIYVFHGSNNGKSAVWQILTKILTAQENITYHTKYMGKPISTYNLDKLLTLFDVENNFWTDNKCLSHVREITSGDTIFTRGLYEHGKIIQPSCKVLIQTNDLPESFGQLANKIEVVKFNENFIKDTNLAKRIWENHTDEIKQLLMSYNQHNGNVNSVNGMGVLNANPEMLDDLINGVSNDNIEDMDAMEFIISI